MVVDKGEENMAKFSLHTVSLGILSSLVFDTYWGGMSSGVRACKVDICYRHTSYTLFIAILIEVSSQLG